MSDKTKFFMKEQIDGIYSTLSDTFGLAVFEDEIAEDEEKKMADDYHCFVFETGDITKADDMKSMTQTITIYYYSENRDDIDERTVDIIRSLAPIKGISFQRSTKQRLQKKDTDRFIDRVIITYSRRIVIGCQV